MCVFLPIIFVLLLLFALALTLAFTQWHVLLSTRHQHLLSWFRSTFALSRREW